MLSPLIDDVKVLENNGIDISFDGINHGTISYISADNLAAHALGRFQEIFSTVFRFCHYCRGTRHEVQHKSTLKGLTLWNREVFDRQAEQLENDVTSTYIWHERKTCP